VWAAVQALREGEALGVVPEDSPVHRALEAMSEHLADEVIVRQGWAAVCLSAQALVCDLTGHFNVHSHQPGANLLRQSLRSLSIQ
jgi:hypothetical protein